jgi:hypothetical protein
MCCSWAEKMTWAKRVGCEKKKKKERGERSGPLLRYGPAGDERSARLSWAQEKEGGGKDLGKV